MIFTSLPPWTPLGANGVPQDLPGRSQGSPRDPQKSLRTSPGSPQRPQGPGTIYTKTPDQPQDAADIIHPVSIDTWRKRRLGLIERYN